MFRRHLVNSKEEYLKWVRKVEYESDGFAKPGDNYELRQQLKNNLPLKYPCMLVYTFETFFSRGGDGRIEICEAVYLTEFTEGFDPYPKENDWEELEKKVALIS
jgi:hypothetical protein